MPTNSKPKPAQKDTSIQEVAEQVVKKKRTRPDSTVQLEPGDVNHFTSNAMEIMRLPKIDTNNPEQVENRVNEYFSICAKNEIKPSVAGLALALGTERQVLWEWVKTGRKGEKVTYTLKRAYQTLNLMMEDYMQAGKINPVAGIFLMKNNMGYTDKQEVVVAPAKPFGDETSAEELNKKYLEDVIDVTEGSKEIE